MSTGARGAAVAMLLAGACGGGAAPEPLAVRGVAVVVESAAPFVQAPDFAARLESTVAEALGYWGGGWRDLDGWTITLTDEPRVACGASTAALGCQDGRSIRFTVRDPGAGPFACVEQTVLVHEVGHAVLGDPLHQDPRWMELEPLQQALAGRAGYTQEGVVPCVLYLSVWRHLLGLP